MACGFFRTAGVAAVGIFLAAVAYAQAPPPAARFDINGYAIEGAPLLRAEDFSRIVSPFIGKQKSAADVQKAQQALQQAYLDLGHCSVQVTVPKAEPDAGTVTLRLVQTPVPVSKDCLPMVVLDDKRAPPVPVAPGEVAVRPFTDVTQAAADVPSPPSTSPAQVARAPLKPLQDRPSAPAVAPPVSTPEIAIAPRETPPDVAVKSLAQAPPQPGLIATPSAPAPVEKPVAVAPPVAMASAPVVPPPAPKPEIALAPPPPPAPKVASPPAPIVAAPVVEPVKPVPPPAPVVAAAPKPEIIPTLPAAPVAVEKPVEKPAPELIAAAPSKPEPVRAPRVVAAPLSAVVEPIKLAPAPEPVIAAAPKPEPAPVAKPQPVVEPVKEQIAAKPEIVPAPPVVAAKPVEKPAPEVVAAAPVKLEPIKPEVAPVVTATKPEPVPAPRIAEAKPPVAVELAKPVPVVTAAVAEPPVQPALAAAPAAAPKTEVVPLPQPKREQQPPEQIAAVPAPAEVVVRPFSGAVATAPEPREPAEVKPAAERAPVRPLQDRPSAIAQEQTPPRVADAAESKPAAKPPSVVVQAPVVPVPALPESPAPADPAAATAALKFDIDRYLIEGNTLLNATAISKVLAGYTGKQKDFADVQRALEALQIAYQKSGWGAVQVTLPEQELERGEVRFEVVETRIGKIDVQGNEFFSEANVRRSVPSLKPGETPNSFAISRGLKVANENAAKQTQVSLKAGSKDGEVDATIKVVDDNPRKYSVSIDNTGTSNTGQLRLGFGFQHSNLWNRDHQLTLQYITNPDHINKVTVLGLGYRIPLYERGDSIDVIVGYSDVDSGTVQQLFNVSGAGLIVLGRYNRYLNRIDDYEHKLTFGLDYKAFQNRVLIGGTALVPDITLHPVSLSYSGELKRDQNAFNFYASLTYNPFEGGNDAAQSDFAASRGSGGGASAEYVIWRYGLNYQRLLTDDWTLRVAANAQTTRNALVAGEQFGLGGANSVRGFNERTYSNDKGHQASVELYTPDIASKLGFEGGRLKLLAFYDTGSLSRNFLQVGEQTGVSVDSIGIGLRMTFREKFNLRMDYAQVMHDGGQDAGIRDGRRNSNTFHASAVFVY